MNSSTTLLDDSKKLNNEKNLSKTSTREKIIKTATKMISHKSYSDLSFEKVAELVLIPDRQNKGKYKSINKATIFHYFKTKSDLVIQIIKFRRNQILEAKEKEDSMQLNPWEKLENFIDVFKYVNVKGICPWTSLNVEINVLPTNVKEVLNEGYNFMINWLAEILTEGREIGEFNFTETAVNKGRFIWSLIQGAWLGSRLTNDYTIYDNMKEQIKSTLR
ncbi:MAG: hypothetical protein HeimC3_05320 [Candidatus Heimdallarchaeota archaeon LC_3]|nr:MAG: hypothetical protein HeimC3_05320 [Candidatus Heimdallarchaeota archaeon LC_3]